MSKILLVDDDTSLVRALNISLTARGYQLDIAKSGPGAIDAAAHGHPDLVLLDLGLPGLGGVEVIRAIRGWSNMPIIVLSARHLGQAKVEALDAGADDYVTKPFAMDELLARIRAAIRRNTPLEEEARFESADLVIDLSLHRVWRTQLENQGDFNQPFQGIDGQGQEVRLTPKEWALVALLVRNSGRLVTQRQILSELWGPEYVTETEYLRVLIARIRRKLEDDSARPIHFMTEPGIGYRFEP
jgi:two-component system KDP operon response regulator KdpE